jgi:hypothetical protein
MSNKVNVGDIFTRNMPVQKGEKTIMSYERLLDLSKDQMPWNYVMYYQDKRPDGTVSTDIQYFYQTCDSDKKLSKQKQIEISFTRYPKQKGSSADMRLANGDRVRVDGTEERRSPNNQDDAAKKIRDGLEFVLQSNEDLRAILQRRGHNLKVEFDGFSSASMGDIGRLPIPSAIDQKPATKASVDPKTGTCK